MDNQPNFPQDHFWYLLSRKLSNEASADELAEFESLLWHHPDWHHQADLLTRMWEQERKRDTLESQSTYMRHLMKYKEDFFPEHSALEQTELPVAIFENNLSEKKFFTRKHILVIAAAFIMIISSWLFFSPSKKAANGVVPDAVSSIATKNGNRTKIVLPDGSQVWLNAGSKLDYNNSVFNKDLREVTLNGEAYFDVTKNAEKPFIIHTKKMDVKVIGTAFNVRSYSDEKIAEASLIRGSIEVTLKDRKDQKIILKPNEKISIATDEAGSPSSKPGKTGVAKNNARSIPQIVVKELKPNPAYNIIPEIAWTQNKFYFEDESLENIAPMMERWFGKKVAITNASLRNLRYYGNFENETMEEVLSYLRLSKPFNFRIEHDIVVIY